MTQLTLATADHFDAVDKLVAAFHTEYQATLADDARAAALKPLLEGSPHGVIYIAGPARAPVGYVTLTFGWSLQLGGLQGVIDEIYIRPGVRGRGIGTEILLALPKQLAPFGLKAVHLHVKKDNETAQRLYKKLGFALETDHNLMTKLL